MRTNYHSREKTEQRRYMYTIYTHSHTHRCMFAYFIVAAFCFVRFLQHFHALLLHLLDENFIARTPRTETQTIKSKIVYKYFEAGDIKQQTKTDGYSALETDKKPQNVTNCMGSKMQL